MAPAVRAPTRSSCTFGAPPKVHDDIAVNLTYKGEVHESETYLAR